MYRCVKERASHRYRRVVFTPAVSLPKWLRNSLLVSACKRAALNYTYLRPNSAYWNYLRNQIRMGTHTSRDDAPSVQAQASLLR